MLFDQTLRNNYGFLVGFFFSFLILGIFACNIALQGSSIEIERIFLFRLRISYQKCLEPKVFWIWVCLFVFLDFERFAHIYI